MASTINASTTSGIIQTADTSGALSLQASNTTIAALTTAGAAITGNLSATGNLTVSGTTTLSSSVIKSGTAVASTSGTSIPYTGIPSWVKRITVIFNGVSTSGTSNILIQLGSGSTTTTGYLSYSLYTGSGGTATGSSTSGFLINTGGNAASILYGSMKIQLISGNSWVEDSTMVMNTSGTIYSVPSSGSITLSGTLDRVVIATGNGTDTFDAGSVNILYE